MLPRACLSGKRYSFNLLTRARARATWPNTRCLRRHPRTFVTVIATPTSETPYQLTTRCKRKDIRCVSTSHLRPHCAIPRSSPPSLTVGVAPTPIPIHQPSCTSHTVPHTLPASVPWPPYHPNPPYPPPLPPGSVLAHVRVTETTRGLVSFCHRHIDYTLIGG